MLPLALAIGIALFMQGWRRGAAAWAVAVLATFAAMLALKVLFLACSGSFGTPDVRTPSGHVAAATVVAGGLAVLLLRWRHAALLVAAMAAGVIGISRLALAHAFTGGGDDRRERWLSRRVDAAAARRSAATGP